MDGGNLKHLVESLFEKAGFHLQTDVEVRGLSGATHALDILFEYKTPITRFRGFAVVVEGELTKEVVELTYFKLMDLPLDKAVIVVGKEPSAELRELGSRLGIEVLCPSKLQVIADKLTAYEYQVFARTYHVEPLLSERAAVEALRRAERHGIFAKRQVLVYQELVYIPVYEYSVDVAIASAAGEGVEMKSANAYFEGIRGSVLSFASDGTLQMHPVLRDLDTMGFDAIALLRQLSEHEGLTLEEIIEQLGWDERKIKRILLMLLDKELIDLSGEKYVARIPEALVEQPRLSTFYRINPGNPPSGRVVKPRADIGKLAHFLEALNSKIYDKRIIMYPVYVGLYERSSGTITCMVMDGNTGKHLDQLEVILSDAGVLHQVEHAYRTKVGK